MSADCTVDGCSSQILARGYCGKHYARVRKHGNPSTVLVSSTVIRPGQVLNPQGGRSFMGASHPNWKGDDCSYAAAHMRVVTRRGKAREHTCVDCGARADEWSYNHADPDEQVYHFAQGNKVQDIAYSPRPEFYEPRCKACHTTLDRLGV